MSEKLKLSEDKFKENLNDSNKKFDVKIKENLRIWVENLKEYRKIVKKFEGEMPDEIKRIVKETLEYENEIYNIIESEDSQEKEEARVREELEESDESEPKPFLTLSTAIEFPNETKSIYQINPNVTL
jgi:hypothetical protein